MHLDFSTANISSTGMPPIGLPFSRIAGQRVLNLLDFLEFVRVLITMCQLFTNIVVYMNLDSNVAIESHKKKKIYVSLSTKVMQT